MPTPRQEQEEEYVGIILRALEVCKEYKPKFGHGSGLTPAEFQSLYQTDPFYAWFGLDSPLLYAAHRAAGGMTSVYRQLGIGCQRLFQILLMDTLGLTAKQSTWSYRIQKPDGKTQTLSLDGRIPAEGVHISRQPAVQDWLQAACREVGVSEERSRGMKGCVFEVRQGYKSKDSKRQNADIANAAAAYSEGYLPVLLLLSTQIDDDITIRYRGVRWLILKGTLVGSTTDSAYAFCRQVLAYDLAAFFHRHSPRFKQEIESTLRVLLG